MNDLLNGGPFTFFDLIVAALILVSSIMALARGFLRELASTAAFLLSVAAAALAFFKGAPMLKQQLGDGVSPWLIELVLVSLSFLIVYVLSAWLGRKLSKLIHAATDIGFIDRVAGLIFGVFRALALVVLILLLAHLFIAEDIENKDDKAPSNVVEIALDWVEQSYTYDKLKDTVIWVQNSFTSTAQGGGEFETSSPEEASADSE